MNFNKAHLLVATSGGHILIFNPGTMELSRVVSGMPDATRPRIIAGWLGIAGVIAAITWAVKGSLLSRSIFLAGAGMVAVVLALVLNRFVPRTRE